MTIGFIVYFVIMYDRGFWMITRGNDSIVRMICELELNVFFISLFIKYMFCLKNIVFICEKWQEYKEDRMIVFLNKKMPQLYMITYIKIM